MENSKKPLTAYDYLRKQIRNHYKQKFDHTTQEYRPAVLASMQDAIFGLETLSDPKINKLVQNPQAHFYILHNLPLPKRFKQTHTNSTTESSYEDLINQLSKIGNSKRKLQKFRTKAQPFLVVAALLGAGAALYSERTNHNAKPALIGSILALVAYAHNNTQNNLLPPYPKTPDLTR